LCQTRDANENPQRRDFGEGEYNVTSTQKLIYMPDQLGSVRDVLDGTTGSLVDAYDYAPYGSNDRSYGTTPTDYRFAGLLYHSASALNLGTYRALDGVTGRFVNRDPIGFMGSINLYDYARGNPIRRTDALGLCDDPNNKKRPCIPPEALAPDERAEIAALSWTAQQLGGVWGFGASGTAAYGPPSWGGGAGSLTGLWIADSHGNEGLYWSVNSGPAASKGAGWIVGLQFTVSLKSGVTVQDIVNSSISFGFGAGNGLAAAGDFSPQTYATSLILGFGAGGWGGATGMNIASGFIPICKE
jgi:RHS repeat-associated protein